MSYFHRPLSPSLYVWLFLTFVAEVVFASSSIAGGTRRARGPMFVRCMAPPVSPVHMKHQTKTTEHRQTRTALTTSDRYDVTSKRPDTIINSSQCWCTTYLLTSVNSCRQDRQLWPRSAPTRSCCNTS